jgi:hypothetical protein
MRITRAIERGRLNFTAKRKMKELEQYRLIKKLQNGTLDKNIFFVIQSMQAIRFIIIGATCLVLSIISLGSINEGLSQAIDVMKNSSIQSLSFYLAFLIFCPIAILLLTATFTITLSFRVRTNVLEVAERLNNIAEYEECIRQNWGADFELEGTNP